MGILALLKGYLVANPGPIIGAKTIQIFLLREVLDYTALRTEDTKELNTVATPLSINDKTQVSRVGFLASKQKAVESRELERMLRTAVENNNSKIGNKLALEYNIKYLDKDFKKQDGFKKATEFSRKLNVYRQNYCGCEFSMIKRSKN